MFEMPEPPSPLESYDSDFTEHNSFDDFMNSNDHRLKDERKEINKVEDYIYNKQTYLPSFNQKAYDMLEQI